MTKIEILVDTSKLVELVENPEDSKFLLKVGHGTLCRPNIHNETYYVVAV